MSKAIQSKKDDSKQTNETRLQGFASLCGTLAIGLFVMTFIFQNFAIPSSSMASTLLVGDHVLVERATLSPSTTVAPFIPYRELHRGEPVVFYKPVVEPTGEHAKRSASSTETPSRAETAAGIARSMNGTPKRWASRGPTRLPPDP